MKRKAPPTTGSGMKKAKTIPLREPSSTGGDQSKVVSLEKVKTPTKTGEPLKVSSSEGTKASTDPIPAKLIQSVPSMEGTTTKDKVKGVETEETENVTTVNFKLPSDFLMDGVMDREKIFPDLWNFLLPSFKVRYQGVSVDETGSHAAGLSFMAFQASLCLYGQMDKVRRAIPRALEKMRKAQDDARKAREEGQTDKDKVEELSTRFDDAKSSLEVAGSEKEELKTRLKEALDRVSAAEAEATTTKASLVDRDQTIGELRLLVQSEEKVISELEEKLASLEAFTRLKA